MYLIMNSGSGFIYNLNILNWEFLLLLGGGSVLVVEWLKR